MQEPKRLNRDWTVKEKRPPRKNEVVIDGDGNFGVVIRTEGDLKQRFLWVHDRCGQEIYAREDGEQFSLADSTQTKKFYIEYKTNQGWTKGRVVKLTGKDYPLQLVELEYDLVYQEVVYVFKDLTTPETKYLKTSNEKIVEFLPEWEEQLCEIVFHPDPLSRLSHEIEVNVRENDTRRDGWAVSGKSFSFASKDSAMHEIDRWVISMKIRRLCSALQRNSPGTLSQIAMGEENPYVTEAKLNVGQPLFVSKCAAALALVKLGDDWNKYLSPTIDEYDI